MTTRTGTVRRLAAAMIAGAAIGCVAPSAIADTIFETNSPFGGFLGLNGFDVSTGQRVAARFTTTTAMTFDRASIWFISNDFDGTTPQTVTVSLRADVNPGGGFTSVPSEVVLESWTMDLPIVGWDPQLVPFDSTAHTALAASTNYWIVAESPVAPGISPVWCWSSVGNEFTATDNQGAGWASGSGAAVGIKVEGTPAGNACPADFNGGGLTVQDIFDFLNAWFAGNASADFNGGGLAVQDIFDFLNAWFAGCP